MAEVSHSYIKTLDGWRALAVVAVILAHMRDAIVSPASSFSQVLSAGINGVDLFFAISGYLIGRNLLKEIKRTHSVDFKTFYLKRFFRLMPTAWFYLIVISILSFAGLIKVYGVEIISTITFWRNYLILSDPHATATGQFWSLTVEEHFYFFLPAFLFFIRDPKKILYSIIGIGVTVAIWRKLGTMPIMIEKFPFIEYTMWNTFGRFDTLLYGVLLAVLEQNFSWVTERLKRIHPLIPITALIILLSVKVPMRPIFEALLYPIIFFSTISFDRSLLSRFLEWSPLKYLGRISYSLYVWQQLFTHEFAGLSVGWHSLIIILLVSILSYQLIEEPCRKFGVKFLAKQKNLPHPTP